MDQPDIAPLARRLAEENNVDWRRLQGSGDDGRVVERDVLEYLARVMAGEEAVDPTPEPVPVGMEAWPEGDTRTLESDDDPDDPAAATSTVEDDIFLFEDTPAAAPPRQEGDGERSPEPLLAEPAHDDEDVGEEDLLVAGDAEPFPPERTPEPPEAPQAKGGPGDEAATAPEPGPALPDLFASSDDESSQTTPPAVFGDHDEAPGDAWSTPAWRQGPSLDAEADDAAPARTAAAELQLDHDAVDDAHEVPAAADADAGTGAGSEVRDEASGFDDHLDLDEVEVDEPLLEADDQLHAIPNLDAPVADAPVAEVPVGDAPVAEVPVADAPVGDAPVADAPVGDAPAADAPVGDAPVGDAPVGDAPAGDAPVGDAPVGDAPSEAPLVVPPPLAAARAEATQAALPSALPLLSHGHVWRRQVDLSALVAAQADLAIELGRDSPVPLSAFLVRAAHKALAGAGFVALALVEHADVRTVALPVAADFASLVSALSDPLGRDAALGESDGVPALVVADLSEFGVDDAVLRLGAPVLTLGRLLIDNQSGGRRAMLALAGDGADGAEAAQLLGRVADLLEVPVRLVL